MPLFYDLFDVAEKALASGKKLPDLFLCIGGDDFLYEKVGAFSRFLAENWKGSRFRYDDMPGYSHEFSLWDIEVDQFMNWTDRKDSYKKMGIKWE